MQSITWMTFHIYKLYLDKLVKITQQNEIKILIDSLINTIK